MSDLLTPEHTATCGGCDRPIVLTTHTTNRGVTVSTWNFVEEKAWCVVHDPSHYVTDVDGGVIGDQSHFPEGSTSTKVNEW